MGHAALRDQKIGNALRTIDTWYPPGAVRPAAATWNWRRQPRSQEFFRDKETSTAFEFARRLNTLDPASPDGMFMIARSSAAACFSGEW